MANEYLVNSSDMTAVADAIRAKGGTSDALTFPGGFVEAVGAIQAGVGSSDELKALVDRSITSLPNLVGISTIGDNAFRGCSVMEGTVFPSSVTTIMNSAFAGCKKIAFTELNDNITSIRAYAFQDCNSLALTKLPPKLGIGGWIEIFVFQRCYALSIKEIPESVSGISQSAFEDCTGLTSMYFPVKITLSGYVFSGCTNLASVTFGATANKIESTAFRNCTALTTINVPWAEGDVANAPWGATNATINYNYVAEGA